MKDAGPLGTASFCGKIRINILQSLQKIEEVLYGT